MSFDRAFLFDYGGTLDGEGWHWFDRVLHLYRTAGATIPEERIKQAFYAADRALDGAVAGMSLRPLIERHVEAQIEVLGDEGRPYASGLVDGFCKITEEGWAAARACLERLGRQARLGVVSNFYGNLDTLLEEAGLRPHLSVVVESIHVEVAKPDPRIYRIALERLGLEPAGVVMVGDNFERDVRAAKQVGMWTVWLRRNGGAPPEQGIADLVVSRLSEIPGR